MTSFKQHGRRKGYMLSAALLATTVLGGGGFLLSSAVADTTPTAPLSAPATMGQAGFADLVTKVKPAVVNIATEGKKVGANEQQDAPQGMPQIPGMPHAGPGRPAGFPAAPCAGLGLHHRSGRLCRHQQPCHRRRRQDHRHLDDGSSYKAKLIGRDRQDRSGAAEDRGRASRFPSSPSAIPAMPGSATG